MLLHDKSDQLLLFFNISHKDSLGKYLGCPIFRGWPSNTIFQEIINKATTKLESWKVNYLSQAGGTVLIQSHLESLLVDTMQCFELHPIGSTYLDKFNWDSFRKNSNVEKDLPMIAWNKVYMPRSKGGMWLRKTNATNKAFQCKLA